MSRVTSKLQVTIPKRIAEQYGIEPGDEIEFVGAAESLRVVLPGGTQRDAPADVEERLHWFDQATSRQRERERRTRRASPTTSSDRGWAREDLYPRERSR
jgi:AbrB family looped-hinge helix DNA binding protein